MGVSLEQYRSAIGIFNGGSHKDSCSDNSLDNSLDPASHLDGLAGEVLQSCTLKGPWKLHAGALLLLVLTLTATSLTGSCLGTLLLRSGLESNPGPTTMMSDTAENRKNVLAALQVKAESENKTSVRDCLRIYKEGQTTKQLKRSLNVANKDILVMTMDFLKVPGEDTYNKGTVVDHMITRIQNLLPDKCNHCKEEYVVDVDDKPLMLCEVCGQGAHTECITNLLGVTDEATTEDAMKKINPLNVHGVHYMCGECIDLYISSPETGKLVKKRNKSGPVQQAPIIVDDNNADKSNDSGSESPDSSDSSDEDSSSSSSSESEVEDKRAKQKRKKRHPRSTHGREENSKKTKKEQAKSTCPFYRKGTCRYGISGKGCSKSHPAPCRKLLNHGTQNDRGCNKGKGCENFHPKMCTSSLNHGECLLETCRLRHVRGTKRFLVPRNNHNARQDNREHQKYHQKPDSAGSNGDFLDALKVLKIELMEAMDIKLQSLQRLQTAPGVGMPQYMPTYPTYMMRPPHHH